MRARVRYCPLMTTVFRTNADGSLVCPHRDLSCCEECADHPLVVDVLGAHYLFATTDQADAMRLEMGASL